MHQYRAKKAELKMATQAYFQSKLEENPGEPPPRRRTGGYFGSAVRGVEWVGAEPPLGATGHYLKLNRLLFRTYPWTGRVTRGL